ncbi:alpha/beta hydrolase [Parvibaculaceae bacterium PLY_AMNH_Bact1]|nr:alpha/beta hydrolase [Parvibaculaceae bacterium PLY_AMNH_Bact1]
MQADIEHLSRVAQIAGLDIQIEAPRHHHAVLNCRRFHFVEWGTAGNPPLLFLHGGNQSARTWDIVCLALADRFHCIALDQRGHGDSEWSYEGHYRPEHHAEDFAALSKHLGWKRFGLIGMSMGGINALSFASQNWQHLSALVCVDVGPFVQMDKAKALVSFVQANTKRQSFDDFVNAALTHNPRRKEELLRHSLTHTTRELSDGSWSWKADRREKLDMTEMSGRLNKLEQACRHIECRTLVVRGEKSPTFSKEDAQRFVHLLPNGELTVVANAGHTVQGDNPKGLIKALEGFL